MVLGRFFDKFLINASLTHCLPLSLINTLSTAFYRHVQFHSIFDGEKHVIEVSYHRKRKRIELKLGKKREGVNK